MNDENKIVERRSRFGPIPGSHHFSKRMLLYKANRLIGMDRINAAIAAGYRKTSAQIMSRRNEKVFADTMIDALTRAGATDAELAKRLVKKFDAQRPIISKGGVITGETDDHKTQLTALIEACKMKGHLKPDLLIQRNEQTNFTVILSDSKNEKPDDHAHAEADRGVPASNE